ncbi:hypothetical protein X757_16845 [Mesorhizobium sp. LSHC414A00]|nr:hypothetical protein X757_16845 [Mesorhizobium sp. LSHC414A00]
MGEAAFGAISFFREREDIALELAKGIGIRAIARKLGRPPSTISREVRRNAATRSGNLDYRPVPPNGTPIVSPGGLLASWRSIRLCVNVEERLAGKVTNPNGASFEGPKVGMEKTTEPEVVGSLEPRADR